MPFRPANLVHTDEGDLVESSASATLNGSSEPGMRSSAEEHHVHTVGVVGSNPTASTIRHRRKKLHTSRLSARDIEVIRAHGWEVEEALERTNPKDRSGHFTYVIASSHALKIGQSNAPKKRLSSLQSGSPLSLHLEKTWKLPKARAQLLERQLHTAFSWCYSHGEWFTAPIRAVEAVGDLFAAGRFADALVLADLVRQIEESDARLERLRHAWYYCHGKPMERRRAEIEAKAQIPDAERENARVQLAAIELGYTRLRGERTQDFNRRVELLKAKAA